MDYIVPLQNLIDEFAKIKGVGRKTATRYAFSILSMSDESVEEFARALISAKRDICHCSVCGNLSDDDVCKICSDGRRDTSVICVVEDERTLMAIEKVREYNGLYHVLGGLISPMDGVGPESLFIKELLLRLEDAEVKEVIMATNPTVEGEATAMYISRLLKPLGVIVSRLAYGIPVGGNLEYADEVTLYRAIEGRSRM